MPFLLLAAALAAPPPAPLALDLAMARNADLVGEGRPISATEFSSAKAVLAAWPTIPAEAAKDAVALRSASQPKAPRRVDVDAVGAGPFVHVLATVDGVVPRGTPVLRVHFVYADDTKSWADLKSGEDLFPLQAGGSTAGVRALGLGDGRALSVVSVRNPKPTAALKQVGFEGRGAAATVYILGAALGEAHPQNPQPPVDLLPPGFSFPLAVDSPPPPIPAAWVVSGPVGARGKVTVKDGHFAWADGTRARFWGINLLQEACTPPKDLAPRLAKQIAAFGFNLVRLHHCDTERAGTIRKDRKLGESPLDPEGIDRFDFFVAELAKAGVHLWFETATNRVFTEADGVSNPGSDVPNGHKLLPIFEADWRAVYLGWARTWLGRTNPYTGRRYADDPLVAVVELTNEHSLVMNWMTGGIEKLAPVHRDALDKQWAAFVKGRYADEAAVRAAWAGSINPGLRPGESYAAPSRQPYGQASFAQWPPARVADLYDFYVALEEPFFADVSREVRDLGYTQPIVAGITYGQPAVARIAGTYDVVDIHLEWDVPAGDTQRNDSILSHPRSQNLPDRFREAQYGKPFTVSELNHFNPNENQSEAPIFWSTMAAVQDWDALVWLNYTNGPASEVAGPVYGPTELRNNVPKWAQMPVASGLFRSGLVPPATGLLASWRSEAEVKDEVVEGDRPGLTQVRDAAFLLGHRIRDAYGDAPPESRAGSPGSQVGWWPDAERFVVQTPGAQAVLGDHALRFRAGKGEGAGPTGATALDPQLNDAAAVSLVCVDGADLTSCGRALLTVAGTVHNFGAASTGGGAVQLDAGGERALVSRPGGSIRFGWRGKPTVRAIAVDGSRGAALAVQPSGTGWWTLDLDTAGDTVWWEVSK